MEGSRKKGPQLLSLELSGFLVPSPKNRVTLPVPEPQALSDCCQPGVAVAVRDGVESEVSDAVVILQGRDGLWALVVFPAAEVRAMEHTCMERKGSKTGAGSCIPCSSYTYLL